MTIPSTRQTTASTWTIDPAHSLVEFSAKHMMFTTVKGRFSGVSGAIVYFGDDVARSSVHVEIDVASIATGDLQRDRHLMSPDFLDVENFPKITFNSRTVKGTRERFVISGDLTISPHHARSCLGGRVPGGGQESVGKDCRRL